MSVLIQDIIDSLDAEAPFSLAEQWDNVGLLVGDPRQQVRSVLIGLDATTELVDEAIDRGADVLLTHHPVIFKPLARIDTSSPEGKLLAKSLTHSLALIAAHTNLDSATAGVSDILGERIGLTNMTPLIPAGAGFLPAEGLGRIGVLPTRQDRGQFLAAVLQALGLEAVQVAGQLPEKIERVAVCGGSGSDFAAAAYEAGVDVYLSAEIKHATARWAIERGFCIIDGTHYGTEKLATQLLAHTLLRISADRGWALEIMQTRTETSPFRWMQMRSFCKE